MNSPVLSCYSHRGFAVGAFGNDFYEKIIVRCRGWGGGILIRAPVPHQGLALVKIEPRQGVSQFGWTARSGEMELAFGGAPFQLYRIGQLRGIDAEEKNPIARVRRFL